MHASEGQLAAWLHMPGSTRPNRSAAAVHHPLNTSTPSTTAAMRVVGALEGAVAQELQSAESAVAQELQSATAYAAHGAHDAAESLVSSTSALVLRFKTWAAAHGAPASLLQLPDPTYTVALVLAPLALLLLLLACVLCPRCGGSCCPCARTRSVRVVATSDEESQGTLPLLSGGKGALRSDASSGVRTSDTGWYSWLCCCCCCLRGNGAAASDASSKTGAIGGGGDTYSQMKHVVKNGNWRPCCEGSSL